MKSINFTLSREVAKVRTKKCKSVSHRSVPGEQPRSVSSKQPNSKENSVRPMLRRSKTLLVKGIFKSDSKGVMKWM